MKTVFTLRANNQFFGRCPSILWARVRFKEEESSVSVYRGSVFSDSEKRLTKLPPVPFWQIRIDGLADYVERWMAFEGDRRYAANMLASLLGEWRMPLQLQFFASTTMLEALARSISKNPYTKDEVEELVAPMLEAADAKILDRTRGLLSMLERPSYAMLLRKVYEESGDWGRRLIPDWKRFEKEQRDLRNGGAHGGDTSEGRRAMIDHYHAQLALAYIVLMKCLNCSDAMVDEFERSSFQNVARWGTAERYSAD